MHARTHAPSPHSQDLDAPSAGVSEIGRRVRSSYVIKLAEVDPDLLLGGRIHVVHDIAFLDGYYEPTLVVCVSLTAMEIVSKS